MTFWFKRRSRSKQSDKAMARLVRRLVTDGVLQTQRIIKAFRAIDRRDFVAAEHRGTAYSDTALPIGYGQTISQPLTVAIMLELLQPFPGDRVLDIGSGSGYQAALLAHIVSGQRNKETKKQRNRGGVVFAVERIKELCELGERNINKYSYVKKGIVRFYCQDGSEGLPKQAPFDRIIVAAAGAQVPAELKEQVKAGGRIVMPVTGHWGQDLVMLEKQADNSFHEERRPGFVFVPLVSDV